MKDPHVYLVFEKDKDGDIVGLTVNHLRRNPDRIEVAYQWFRPDAD